MHLIEKSKETLRGLVKNDPLIKKFSPVKEEDVYAQDRGKPATER